MPKDNLLKEATLIQKADKVIKANKTAQKQYNFGFNIFTTLNIERDEVFAHSNMIYALLNSRGNHGMGDTYLKLFLKEIGISKTFLNYSWSVEREWVFENGRIDFFLKCKKMCIAIEMKIDAGDKDKQLFRYEEYSKGVNSNYLIYYLTLDGKYPSEQSADGIDKRYFKCISFKVHILNWLKTSLVNRVSVLISWLYGFIILLIYDFIYIPNISFPGDHFFQHTSNKGIVRGVLSVLVYFYFYHWPVIYTL